MFPKHIGEMIKRMSDENLSAELRSHGHIVWLIQAEQMRRAENGPKECDVSACANEEPSPESEAGQSDDLIPKTPTV